MTRNHRFWFGKCSQMALSILIKNLKQRHRGLVVTSVDKTKTTMCLAMKSCNSCPVAEGPGKQTAAVSVLPDPWLPTLPAALLCFPHLVRAPFSGTVIMQRPD